jgi:hypothetical protein
MRALVWMTALMLLISAAAVTAIDCDDLDEQPDIEDTLHTKAIVEYGIEDKADTCVSGKDGYTKDPSTWVREYYCEESPAGGEGTGTVMQRKYKDFDCTRYGFEKCEGGKCVGGAKASTNTSSVKKPAAAQPSCGDHKVQADRGEQCDPPDDICYVGSDIGICSRPASGGFGGCQCKLYKGGSGTATPETATETAATTTTTVKPAAEEKAPEEAPAEQPPAEPEKAPTAEEREPLPTEYEPPAGIGVTRGISNGIKSFFRWIGSWFD